MQEYTTVQEVALPGGGTARLGITFTLDCTEALRVLEGMLERIEDPAPLLDEMAGILRGALSENFSRGGRPAWEPLRPSTIARKAGAGMPRRTKKGNIPRRLVQNGAFGPGNILIASGALRDSYVVKSAVGHVETIDAKAGTVAVGSDLKTRDGKPLALFHQQGARPFVIRNGFGRGVVIHHPGYPARPQTVTEEDADKMAQALAHYLMAEKTEKVA